MDKSIDLDQGTIHYRDEGDGAPLMFVHGLLVDGSLWREVTPHLTASYRCLVADWPLGSHRSPLAAGADRSPRGIAHLIADFIERLDLDGVTVVANDTGGAISQILASERPERLGGLILTNCDCLENFLPPLFRPLQWLAHVPGAYRLIAWGMRSARLRRSPLAFGMLTHATIPDELTAKWATPLRRPEIRADVVQTLRAIDSRDTIAAAQRLSEHPLPTLLAWAPEDRSFTLDSAERLAAMIPGCRIEQIPGSRAFVPIDQPLLLANAIAEFVAAAGETPYATTRGRTRRASSTASSGVAKDSRAL